MGRGKEGIIRQIHPTMGKGKKIENGGRESGVSEGEAKWRYIVRRGQWKEEEKMGGCKSSGIIPKGEEEEEDVTVAAFIPISKCQTEKEGKSYVKKGKKATPSTG